MATTGFFYDKNKKELMGSDVLFTCDGRLNRASVIYEAKRQSYSHRKVADRSYVRLYRGTILNPHFYTGLIPLK
jgi:hypothetical protein